MSRVRLAFAPETGRSVPAQTQLVEVSAAASTNGVVVMRCSGDQRTWALDA